VITVAKRGTCATMTSFGDKSSMRILLVLNCKILFTMAAMLELFKFADPFPFAFEVLLHIVLAVQLGDLVEQ